MKCVLMCCREGAYARVFGVPRKFRGAVVFDIIFIRLVEDPHEVFFHLMEAMVATFQHSRGQPLVCTFSSSSTASSASTFVCHSHNFTTRRSRG